MLDISIETYTELNMFPSDFPKAMALTFTDAEGTLVELDFGVRHVKSCQLPLTGSWHPVLLLGVMINRLEQRLQETVWPKVFTRSFQRMYSGP